MSCRYYQILFCTIHVYDCRVTVLIVPHEVCIDTCYFVLLYSDVHVYTYVHAHATVLKDTIEK